MLNAEKYADEAIRVRNELIETFTFDQWQQILSIVKPKDRQENFKTLKAWLGFLHFTGVEGKPTSLGEGILRAVWLILDGLDSGPEHYNICRAVDMLSILKENKARLSKGESIMTDVLKTGSSDKSLQKKGMTFLKSNTDDRITQKFLDKQIESIDYLNPDDTTVVLCIVRLINGTVVTGRSGSLSENNYSDSIGKKLSKKNAMGKLWQLYGFAAKQKAFEFSDDANTDTILPWKFD